MYLIRQIILYSMLWTAVACTAAIFGSLGYWIQDREYPIHTISSKLLTQEVRAGEEIRTERVLIRDKLCYTTIDRYFTDATGARYDTGLTEYPNGTGILGEDTFIGIQQVPLTMPPGNASFTSIVCYKCNPLHWIWPVCEPPRTRIFKILPPVESDDPTKAP